MQSYFAKKFILVVTFLIGIFLSSVSLATLPSFDSNHKDVASLAPMLKKVLPGVVNISVRGEMMYKINPFAGPKPINPSEQINPDGQATQPGPKFNDLGSGVIVDAKMGYILTNAHLVKDAQVITVNLDDGRRVRATMVGYDVPSDIAVIQIKAKRLNELAFGDADKLKVGDYVAAIGNPFGLQQTVTSGVISGLERSNLGIEGYENFIQTDAPINPGNSGGALVNMQGELIGINTAIITPFGGNIGIGLAIPSNMARSVMNQLIKYGKVKRGILGVLVQNVTPGLADAMHLESDKGALVSQVNFGSPAAKAGLQPKDVIVELNGKEIRNSFQVSNGISLLRVGSKVDLVVLRNNKKLNFSANIIDPEELDKLRKEASKELLDGVQLRDFDQLVNGHHLQGVEVISVDDTSIAYSSGLRASDVILMAADKPVPNIAALAGLVEQNSEHLLLAIKRGNGGNIFLVLEE